jgi:hypothetical protein
VRNECRDHFSFINVVDTLFQFLSKHLTAVMSKKKPINKCHVSQMPYQYYFFKKKKIKYKNNKEKKLGLAKKKKKN